MSKINTSTSCRCGGRSAPWSPTASTRRASPSSRRTCSRRLSATSTRSSWRASWFGGRSSAGTRPRCSATGPKGAHAGALAVGRCRWPAKRPTSQRVWRLSSLRSRSTCWYGARRGTSASCPRRCTSSPSWRWALTTGPSSPASPRPVGEQAIASCRGSFAPCTAWCSRSGTCMCRGLASSGTKRSSGRHSTISYPPMLRTMTIGTNSLATRGV
mmetsp:Transcript_39005/g.117807  ORF Transcript_39005/g.117807 Transcript_39005/m.117807 type:complete len:214 (-) Transcript_39005:2151-2792(-)